jgi:hypothetical protein
MGAMKAQLYGTRDDVGRVFVETTKSIARANALGIAHQKGTGVFLFATRSPESEAGLRKAASLFRYVPHTPVSLEEQALGAARGQDVTAWWSWDFRNDTPKLFRQGDEWFGPQEVDRLAARFGGDWKVLETMGDPGRA